MTSKTFGKIPRAVNTPTWTLMEKDTAAGEFERHILPNSGLKLLVGHGFGPSKYRLQYYLPDIRSSPADHVPVDKDEKLNADEYAYGFIGNRNAHKFLIITTPDSFHNHVVVPTSYQHRYSEIRVHRRKESTHNVVQNIPSLICGFIAIDEAHRWVSRDKRPWHDIKQLHKHHAQDYIPSCLPMSGTPIFTGPRNIIGPLMCLKDERETFKRHYIDPHGVTVQDLETFELEWIQLIKKLKVGTTSRKAAASRLKHHLWFGISKEGTEPKHQLVKPDLATGNVESMPVDDQQILAKATVVSDANGTNDRLSALALVSSHRANSCFLETLRDIIKKGCTKLTISPTGGSNMIVVLH
ncbi:hypothetical protein G7Y79_00039g075550 [Physcia stellaris]|nr:hypothetical protein G7Y79_00039g075550 [Physcia stellaris]